ncbi:hypothetical protein [Flavobacterium frigidarium]|jgi:hypothetical protein|uniref:hypothetical protein n=1 Tax=Flavobacterium frigidarium TaxID=99286 RepID=UPI00047DD7CE|nr:hypothetical protein [Flavobacterium frigidarium]
MKLYLSLKTAFLILISIQTCAQIKAPVKLDKNEKYCADSQQKGNFFRVAAVVFNEEQTQTTGEETNIRIYFPENFYVEGVNGNKYAKGYLENNTLNNIEVNRIDSTIDFVQEYFLINDKWISGQENGKSDCGNSYFKKELKAKRKIEFQLSISDLVYGNIKVPFKIVMTINGKKVESNVIEVNLFESQIKNLIK